ncbi:MAG TPA: acyltransferase [Thermoanaerobaculia bacterium]|nr:acyltransferase [Thermoanaerobaculia bacterium]
MTSGISHPDLSGAAAPGDSSALGHAARVHVRSGLTDRARYLARNLLLFGANRVIGQLPGHALRLAYYRRALGWRIGERTSIHHGLKIFGGRGRVTLGNRSTFQMDCLIVGAGMDDLVVGDNVAIAYRVNLLLGSHDIFSPTFNGITGPIMIEDRVFVGTGATILLGVTLGEGTVVTAGSVVSKSTPPFSIVRGNPASVVGRRPRNLDFSAEHFWAFH